MDEGIHIVTGGGRGIGAATARSLAQTGRDLCLTWTSRPEGAEQVAQECRRLGVRVLTVQADVSVEADVVTLFERAGALGYVQGVVNNAGVLGPQGRLDAFDAARMARTLEVNTLGTLLCCREAVRHMSTRRGGRGGSIVNVSSRAAVLGAANEYVDYAASKAAVDALTVGLAREVAGEGVRVNAVRPALIRTEIHASGGDPGRVERLQDKVPMGRGGEPEEVATAVVWLLSVDSSFVTGALVDVAGGL